MVKETIEIDGIKYVLHDKDAVKGDKIIITHKHPISEGIFEIGDIYKVESISSNGMALASKDGDNAVIYRSEYKVICSSDNETSPDKSDTEIIDILASISQNLLTLTGRIASVESDIKDLRENLTEELYESHSKINDLHGLVHNVRDYTLDLTETIEMHTDDIVLLDERTQDLLIDDNYK